MIQMNSSQPETAVSFQSLKQIQRGVKDALEIVMGDSSVETLDEMSSIFMEDAIPLIDQMKNGHSSQDFHSIFVAAHTLKGSSASIGLIQFADLCLAIEVSSKQQRANQLSNHISSLESEYAQIQEALTAFLI